jgi:tRNA U34 5-methylaminomethyl-2-thiouridine-forming methyltransferase MnmC
MKNFNDNEHSMTLSEDGSYTAYSKEYDEHYHSTKDGALSESLYKHIIPACKLTQEKNELNILDICYGLGFNTLATILYYKEHAPEKKLSIYSPELDSKLIASLTEFSYPEEFALLGEIITALSREQKYEDEQLSIELFLGDAREYVKQFEDHFDIVYQDAFSPSSNPVLWTKEYFSDIKRAMREDGLLTTYSTALKTRLALYENGFFIYLNEGEEFRAATLASRKELEGYKRVDMEHKISCNPDVKPLSDAELGVDYR